MSTPGSGIIGPQPLGRITLVTYLANISAINGFIQHSMHVGSPKIWHGCGSSAIGPPPFSKIILVTFLERSRAILVQNEDLRI